MRVLTHCCLEGIHTGAHAHTHTHTCTTNSTDTDEPVKPQVHNTQHWKIRRPLKPGNLSFVSTKFSRSHVAEPKGDIAVL